MEDQELQVVSPLTQHGIVSATSLNIHGAVQTDASDVIQLSGAPPLILTLRDDVLRPRGIMEVSTTTAAEESPHPTLLNELIQDAEPKAPTSTMAWFVSHGSGSVQAASSKGKSVPIPGNDTHYSNLSLIHAPNGLISTLLAYDGGGKDCAQVRDCDDITAPFNDASFPWSSALKLPLAEDMRCGACGVQIQSSKDDVFRYTSKQHRTVHPMWGAEHPSRAFNTTGLINPNDIDLVDASSSSFSNPSSSSSSSSSSRVVPDALYCGDGHLTCMICLGRSWISYASRADSNDGRFARLICPNENCRCAFSMKKFWRTLYSASVYRLLRDDYTQRGLLHEFQWFYLVWFPITSITKLHWDRVRNHPESLCWRPMGISPFECIPSKLATAEWIWRRNGCDEMDAGQARTLCFGVSSAITTDGNCVQSSCDDDGNARVHSRVSLACMSLMNWVEESCRLIFIDDASGETLPIDEFMWESQVSVSSRPVNASFSSALFSLHESATAASTRYGLEVLPSGDLRDDTSKSLFRTLTWLAHHPCPMCGYCSMSILECDLDEANVTSRCASCHATWCKVCRRQARADDKHGPHWREFLSSAQCAADHGADDSFVIHFLARIGAFFSTEAQQAALEQCIQKVAAWMSS